MINATIRRYLWTDTRMSKTIRVFSAGQLIEYPVFVPDAIAAVGVSFIFPDSVDGEGECAIDSVVYDIAKQVVELHVAEDACMVSYRRQELEPLLGDDAAIDFFLKATIDKAVAAHVQRGWRIVR